MAVNRDKPNLTTPRRVAIYARRSDESGDRDRSITEQIAACRRWASERGHTVVQVFEELGSGVTGADRAVFVGMIESAERKPRPFDLIVVLDLSRFGRADVDETGYWRHRLRKAGVEVGYVLDGDKLNGETGQLVGSVLQVAARDHSIKTGYKVALAHAALVERGFWPGGRVPFGYRAVRRPGWDGIGPRQVTLAVDEAKAAIVRRIFGSYETGGSPNMIARALNEEKISSPKGKPWHRSTVLGILGNPAYAGDLMLNVRRPRHSVQRPKFYRAGSAGPIESGTEAPPLVKRDAFPAIITRKQWSCVAKIIEERTVIQTGGTPLLLTGIAKCGVCGGPTSAHGGNRTKTVRYRYYKCSRNRYRVPSDRGPCLHSSVRSHALESAVLEVVRAEAALMTPQKLAAEIRRELPAGPSANVAQLEKRRRALAAKRDALLSSEDMASEFLREGLAKLGEEHDRLVQQIQQAKTQPQAVDVDAMIGAALQARDRLNTSPDTPEGRDTLRAALGLFVRDLRISPAPRRKPRPVRLELYSWKAVPFLASRAMLWRLSGN